MLYPELSWLTTRQAENGYRFGYEVGNCDERFSLWSVILDTQRIAPPEATTAFIGGYLRALYEKDPDRRDKELEKIAADPKLNAMTLELTSLSGMTDKSAQLLIGLAKKMPLKQNNLDSFTAEESPELFRQRYLKN